MSCFDWNRAIEINRAALLGVVSLLFGLLSVGEADGTVYLSPKARRWILRLLVPAEAAARRLIFICARVFKPKIALTEGKSLQTELPDFASFARAAEDMARTPHFPLTDPCRAIDWSAFEPPFTLQAASSKVSEKDEPDFPEPVSCTDLFRRAKAMEAALKNLKSSARRMAHEEATRDAAAPGPKHLPPIRRKPIGRRLHGREEVDDILRECHGLAWDVERWPP
ncbi:MAG: hypothetical protein AAGG69_09520 [Pseudomonadota bacterium]